MRWRKEGAPRRIPESVWKNLDKPAPDVGVDVGIEPVLKQCEYLVETGGGSVSLTRANGRTVMVEVRVFLSDNEMKEYKRRCLQGEEDLEDLYVRWAEVGIVVVNGRSGRKKVKGSLRHQVEKIRAWV